MVRLHSTFGTMACLIFISGCGDSHESLMRQQISAMNEAADILATIKDKSSAEAAKPKMKKIGEKLGDLKNRIDRLEKLSESKKVAFESKFKDQLVGAPKRLTDEQLRLISVEGAKEILDDLNKDLK